MLSINVQTGNNPYILYEPVPQLHGAKLKISCHEPRAEACSNLEEDLVFPLTQVNQHNFHGLSWAKDALL